MINSRIINHTKVCKYILWTVVMLLLISGSLMFLASPSYAQDGEEEADVVWTQPIPISSSRPSSWFPDIAVDETGTIHVVWASGVSVMVADGTQDAYDVVMYTSSRDGQTWNDPIDIFSSPYPGFGSYEVTRPTVHSFRNGVLDITYRYLDVFYAHTPSDQVNYANAKPSVRQLSSSGSAYYSQLAHDSEGLFHLVYTENVHTEQCPNCYHLLYRRSSDNGNEWPILLDISLLPSGSGKPQILIDDKDNVHIVWESGRGGGLGQLADPTSVMYAVSYDSGDTWSLPFEFPAPGGLARNPALGITGTNKLIAVWLGLPEARVYYQLSNNRGLRWSEPAPIPGIYGVESRLDSYAMTTDSAGNVHLVMVGRQNPQRQSLEILHTTWSVQNEEWSDPYIVETYPGDAPEWPRLAIGNGNQLHLTWFVRDQEHIFESDAGRYQVWYASAQLNAPGEEFNPEERSEPTHQPEAVFTMTASSDMVPAATEPAGFDSDLPMNSNLESMESMIILVLLRNIAPVAAILFLGVLLVRLLKR